MVNSFRLDIGSYPLYILCDSLCIKLTDINWNISLLKNIRKKHHIIITTKNNRVLIYIRTYNLRFFVPLQNKRKILTYLHFSIELSMILHNTYIFHSSSVVIKNQAYIFLGLSGSGKSTIARLVQPDTILGDDSSIIIINKRSNMKIISTYSFKDNIQSRNSSAKNYIVRVLCKLTKDSLNTVSNLQLQDKMYLLLNNNLLFLYLINSSKTSFLSEKMRKKALKDLFKGVYSIIEYTDVVNINFSLRLNRNTFTSILRL